MIRSERGSATVAVVGLLAVVSLGVVAVVGAGASSAVRQRVIGASDAAALAAADAASGYSAGSPCDLAQRISAANGATVTRCEVDALVATVGVSTMFLGFPVTATSTAGPAPP